MQRNQSSSLSLFATFVSLNELSEQKGLRVEFLSHREGIFACQANGAREKRQWDRYSRVLGEERRAGGMADCKNKSRVQRRRFSLNCINFNPFYCIAFFSIVLSSPFDRIRIRPSRFLFLLVARERASESGSKLARANTIDRARTTESAYNKPWRERQSETKTGLAR